MHFVDFTRDTKQLGQRFMNGQFKLQSRLFPHSTNHSDLFTVSVPLLKWFDNDILDERKETKKSKWTKNHKTNLHFLVKRQIYRGTSLSQNH